MKEVINKVIELTKRIVNNESVKGINFSKQEYQIFDDLKDAFDLLICYPGNGDEEHVSNIDVNIANKIIKHNEILEAIYLEDSNNYLNLMKAKPELKKALLRNETYVDLPTEKYNTNFLLIYKIFEQKGKFLYQYIKVVPNENVFKEITSHIKGKLEFTRAYPMEIKGEERQEIISSSNTLKNEDGSYRVYPKYINFSRLKESNYANYVDVDGVLVFKSFYDAGLYKELLSARKYQTKFTIVDKDGIVVDNDKIDTCQMIEDIRDITAHTSTFSYKLADNNKVAPDGKIFIFKNKENKNEEAIIVPTCFFHTLAHINKLSSKPVDTLSYLYAPRTDKGLNEDTCENYFNICREVRIQINKDINKLELDTLCKYWIYKYIQINQSIQEKDLIGGNIDGLIFKAQNDNDIALQKFLDEKIKKVFKDVSIEILPLENTRLLIDKFVKVLEFLKNDTRDKSGKEQKEYIEFLLNGFYGFDLTDKQIINESGKIDAISIEPRAMLEMMNIIRTFVKGLSQGKNIKTNEYCKYKDELYITLCAFVVYTNLIYNNFDDDIDPTKTRIPAEIKNVLYEKVENLDMRAFKMINRKEKGNDRAHKPETFKNKKAVVSTIRNTIAHFSLKVKFNKTGNPEDNILIFNYGPDAFKSRINQASCKDVLNLITQSLFSEYKQYNHNLIELNNYDELIDVVVRKMQ